MNRKTTIGATILFIVGVIGGNIFVSSLRQPPEPSEQTQSLIGSPLPEFSLLGLDGVRENIKQWQGKALIINFWGTWCPPCKREIPALIDLQSNYQRHGLQVIGIALDRLEPVKDYVNENGINYPILLGDDAIDIAQLLGNDMGLLPYTVIVDQIGNVAYVKNGEADRAVLEEKIKELL